jgi:hypothetical protein
MSLRICMQRMLETGEMDYVAVAEAMTEIERVRAKIRGLEHRVTELTAHLDWVGWNSDGERKANAEIKRLRTALRQIIDQDDIPEARAIASQALVHTEHNDGHC